MSIENIAADLVLLYGANKTNLFSNKVNQGDINKQTIELLEQLLNIIKNQDVKIRAFEKFIDIQAEETERQQENLVTLAEFVKETNESIVDLSSEIDSLLDKSNELNNQIKAIKHFSIQLAICANISPEDLENIDVDLTDE